MGSHGDRGERRVLGDNIVQCGDELSALERDSDLLPHLTDDCGDKIGVLRVTPTAGERHVARPGIILAAGAAYEEQCIGRGNEHDRDRGPHEQWIGLGDAGTVLRERQSQSLEAWAQ